MSHEAEPSRLDALVAQNGDPEVIPSRILQLHRDGKVSAARSALLAHARSEPRSERRHFQEEVLRQLRFWATPAKPPKMFTLNGVGTALYGSYQKGEDGLHVGTLWITLVFLPVFPISAYLVSKAESGGWYFLGKVPLPPAARFVRWLVAAAILLAAGAGLVAGFFASQNTEVVAWNGFDVPVEVTVDGQVATLDAHSAHVFGKVRTERVPLSASFGGVLIEQTEAELAGTSRDTVLYNVGSRGVHELLTIRYGEGDPPEGELVSGGPVLVFDGIDYVFVEPPEQKSVREGGHIDNTVLQSIDAELAAPQLVLLLNEEDRQEDALALLGAELLISDEAHAMAWWASQVLLPEDPEGARAWLRPILEARAGSLELHRAWQELHGLADQPALVAEYRARLVAEPTSPVAMYLLSRLLDAHDDETMTLLEEAVRLDPGLARAFGSLGWNRSIRGEYAQALAAYRAQVDADPSALGEVQDEMVRLTALTGGSLADQVALADALVEEGEVSYLGAHLRAAARPADAPAILADWGGDEGLDPLVEANLRITAGDLGGARALTGGLEERLSVDPMPMMIGLRIALSDGATAGDAERVQAALSGDALPSMTDETALIALAFARKAELADASGALLSLLDDGELAPIAAMVAGDPAGAEAAIRALGLRSQVVAAIALSHTTGAASWRAHARAIGRPDELPRWR